ncbi:dosage compensation regulator-like [Daphnia pulicaria]|uniref:dosage compensation regulator-like n=1 Tax=Daphnia pulicaria TaxID=35523 RepID=UPI001EEB6CD5|nr:dosage compensation regulator-like [Daphnia pulicaria]
MFVSLSSSKMIIPVYLVAFFCTVVLGRLAEKDQQNPERKTDPARLDLKIAHQPGQPDEPHPEIFPSVENVGKDAPGKSELIGEAKSELLESAPVLVPPNPEDALSSRSRRFFLPYLSSYRRPYYRRPYVRGAYYPYSFGGIFGYPYYGAGYGDYGGGYYGGYGDYGGGYGDYGGGYGDYGGGYGDIDIGIDSDY